MTGMHVLVGYSSRFGSTHGVAAHIADRLRGRGHDVTLCAVDEATPVEGYDAVVFGSGVYDGSWTADASAFLRRQTPGLAQVPLWLFSMGSFGDRHPVIGRLVRREPKEIGEFERALHPRGYRVFAGVINLEHWPVWARALFQALGGHDGDNRAWPDIDAWTDEIAVALTAMTPPAGTPPAPVPSSS